MNKFLNKREINKRIVAVRSSTPPWGRRMAYTIKHDIPDEEIVCQVQTLEIAGCIVQALRARQEVKLAEHLLAKHVAKKGKGK
jgi:hypothetical protein